MNYQIGDRIENRYLVQSVLGSGAMGTVYQVADEARDDEVLALKTLRADVQTPELAAYFRREFRVLTQMRHPNLVGVRGYGVTAAGGLYFTMDYVPGQTLTVAVRQRGPEAVVPLIVQVCRALAYIHARGVVHGDLKPSNVLVVSENANDCVKVVDFGLAQEIRPDARAEYGTPGYAAPELLQGQVIDHRADLYALGALWYRLVAGAPPPLPLATTDHGQQIRSALAHALSAPSSVTSVPQSVAVIARLLEPDPAARYASADEVVEALNRAAGGAYALETRETAASYALQGRFVGREAEMQALQEAWAQAQAGNGALALVAGESGVGKTRLVDEFLIQATLTGAWGVTGQCVETGSSPYHPWRDVLRVLVRYARTMDADAIQRLAPILAPLLPALRDHPHVPHAAPLADLDHQAARSRLNQAVIQVLRAAAARRPTVVVIEDGHWADEATLELLLALAREPHLPGLLVCVTYRDDEVTNEHPLHPLILPADDRLRRVRLWRLRPEVTTALARGMLGLETLPSLLARRLQQTTRGNAFFVQELIRSLSEDEVVLRRTAQGWRVDEDALRAADLPASIQQTLLRRLDRLPIRDRAVLQAAAVVGPTFWDGAVAHVGDLAGDAARDALHALQDRGLIVEREPAALGGVREYAFQHAALRSSAYEGVAGEARPGCHARAADWLIAHAGVRTDEYLGAIAGHLEQAGRTGQAVVYLRRAGDHAAAQFANAQAVDYYTRALRAAAGEPALPAAVDQEVLDVLEALGDVEQLTGRYAPAAERFRQAVAHPRCSPRRRANLLQKIARTHELQGQYDEALAYLQKARRALLEDPSAQSAELARILNLSGWVHMRRGEMAQAVADCEEGLAILARLPRDVQVLRDEAEVYNTLGTTHVGQASYATAAEFYQRVTELREQAGDRAGLARAYNNQALAAWGQGDLARAGEHLRRSVAISQQTGNDYVLAYGYNNLGVIAYTLGDAEEALGYYREALALRQRLGDGHGVAQTQINVGEALVSLGCYAEAQEPLEAATAACEALQIRGDLPDVYCLLAQVAFARGDAVAAMNHAARARDVARAIGNPEWEGIAGRLLARGHRERGEAARARRLLEASVALLAGTENRKELDRVRQDLEALLAETPADGRASH